MLQPFFQRLDRLDHVKPLARTGRARDDLDPARAQAQRFEDFIPDLHLFHRIGRERDADRIADPRPEQAAQPDGRFHRARHQAARLGDPQMDRRVGHLTKGLIGSRREEDIGGFHRDLEFVEVIVLQDLDVIHPALDHRIRARLAVFLQQVPLQTARVHADADRAAMILRRLDHLAHAALIPDIARIDPQAGRARLRRLNRALIVEMDIRHDRHRAFAHNLAQRAGAALVGGRDPHDIRTNIGSADHLIQRRAHIRTIGIGHRLDRDRRIAAHRHIAHHDLTRFAAVNIAPRTDRVERHNGVSFGSPQM